jgi:hypothetical protein
MKIIKNLLKTFFIVVKVKSDMEKDKQAFVKMKKSFHFKYGSIKNKTASISSERKINFFV